MQPRRSLSASNPDGGWRFDRDDREVVDRQMDGKAPDPQLVSWLDAFVQSHAARHPRELGRRVKRPRLLKVGGWLLWLAGRARQHRGARKNCERRSPSAHRHQPRLWGLLL